MNEETTTLPSVFATVVQVKWLCYCNLVSHLPRTLSFESRSVTNRATLFLSSVSHISHSSTSTVIVNVMASRG